MVLQNSEDDQKLKRSSQIVQILFNSLTECKILNIVNYSPKFLNLLFTLHPASYSEQLLLTSLFNIFYYNTVRFKKFPFVGITRGFEFIPLIVNGNLPWSRRGSSDAPVNDQRGQVLQWGNVEALVIKQQT